MRLLRDLRQGTKFLILLEVARNPNTKLKTIAGKLGMTVQGVSEYIQRMREEGLIHAIGGYRPTMLGVQFLHENLQELRKFVEDSWRETMIITSCTALAMTKISRGEKVGLFMEKGVLCAYAGKKSSSTGVAEGDAHPGDVVSIRDLEGIVDLTPGKIYLLRVSRKFLAGDMQEYLQKVRRHLSSGEAILVVYGLEAQVLAERLNLKIDVRFGSIEAAIDACQKGVDVLFISSEEFADDLLTRVKEENAIRMEKIVVQEL